MQFHRKRNILIVYCITIIIVTQLISKVESVTKWMRWKALQFLGKLESSGKQTFGFKSTKWPPAIDELEPFESDLQRMISNIEFRPIRNKFLSK